jgi:hypothetical protein
LSNPQRVGLGRIVKSLNSQFVNGIILFDDLANRPFDYFTIQSQNIPPLTALNRLGYKTPRAVESADSILILGSKNRRIFILKFAQAIGCRMPFTTVCGLEGKIYVPQQPKEGTRKHPCRGCYACQQCSDDRCGICLSQKSCRCEKSTEINLEYKEPA